MNINEVVIETVHSIIITTGHNDQYIAAPVINLSQTIGSHHSSVNPSCISLSRGNIFVDQGRHPVYF